MWVYDSMNIKIGIAFVVTTLVIASAGIVSSMVFAQQSQTHFMAKLSAKSTPTRGPNLSFNGTGKATFTVTGGGKAMQYTVNAYKMNHVGDVTLVLYTRGHGHSPSNVVLVRRAVTEGATGPINGLLVQGTIKPSDLVGPLKGKQISVLVKDMLDGKVDLWVTTTAAQLIAGKVIPASAMELAESAAPSGNATAAPSGNATAAPSGNATAAPSGNAKHQ